MLLFETFTGHAEIDDRQQHEDERLDGADEEDIEELPPDQQDHPDGARRSLHQRRSCKRNVPEGEQEHHHQTTENVAEQPEGKTQWLRDLLDDVERRERDARQDRELERLGETAEVATESEHMDA